METLIGWFTPTADAYAERIALLLLTPDIERHSGAMFNSKGQAILPSAGLTEPHIARFLSTSEVLVTRTGIQCAAS